ncbi:MAG: S1C family serine protease, partial [Jiangellaceae bacterium]
GEDSAYAASVIGVDEANDVALLDVGDELEGYTFEFADVVVTPGEAVAVIGHPLGYPLTITSGSASRVDATLWPMFQVDASINPGNSGGPVVRADGDVVGLVSAKDTQAEGLGYAIRGEVVADRVANPNLLALPEPPTCERPLGPSEAAQPDLPADGELEVAVATTLASYFAGINSGDYQLAFDQLSPPLQGSMSMESFAAGLVTSYDFAFDVRSVDETADGALVWLEFVSLQAPEYGPDGESCTNWSLDYELIWSTDGWLLINRVTAHGDAPDHVPCV